MSSSHFEMLIGQILHRRRKDSTDFLTHILHRACLSWPCALARRMVVVSTWKMCRTTVRKALLYCEASKPVKPGLKLVPVAEKMKGAVKRSHCTLLLSGLLRRPLRVLASTVPFGRVELIVFINSLCVDSVAITLDFLLLSSLLLLRKRV